MARASDTPEVDEELLVHRFPSIDRKAVGAFYTPAPVVERTLALALSHLGDGPLTVVDPACGAGAFLAAAARHRPDARLCGLELDPEVARLCQARVPGADVRVGDALRGGLEPLLEGTPEGHAELWVGNPPYNGTSSVLKDAQAYARLRALVPLEMPPGTSLRDDFAFFLLLARKRLEARRGALAFITPTSLLEAFAYAPLRHALLEALHLRDVVDLGHGVFTGAQVRTCITVWTSRAHGEAPTPRYEHKGTGQHFTPEAPEWRLSPIAREALLLDADWRARGEPLTTLIPVSLPGVKTRFDELLVDADAQRLLARLHAFRAATEESLEDFAREHGLDLALVPKLRALKRGPALEVDARHVRPFFRYGGARHRGALPPEARAYCYLDRRLIPRGDHRLRGPYDPHGDAVKLLFNVRELPLAAALLEEPGCVHDHRHARFAPLYVPQRVRDEGLGITRGAATREELGPPVPNLSPRGQAWAERLGGPVEAFRAVVRFLNGAPVQRVWAPAFGTSRVVSVPLEGPLPE